MKLCSWKTHMVRLYPKGMSTNVLCSKREKDRENFLLDNLHPEIIFKHIHQNASFKTLQMVAKTFDHVKKYQLCFHRITDDTEIRLLLGKLFEKPISW